MWRCARETLGRSPIRYVGGALTRVEGGPVRCYNNYKTSGEMAKLKEPSPVELFYDEPKWPKVLDMTPEAIARRERQKFYDEIKSYPSSNHKQFMINVERGRKQVFYNPPVLSYHALESAQYATRTTHRAESATETLPEVSSDVLSLIEQIIVEQNSLSGPRNEMSNCLEPAPIPITSTNYFGSFEGYSVEPGPPVEHKRTLAQHTIGAILDALRSISSLKDSTLLEQSRLEAFWEHPRYRTNKEGDWKDVDYFSPMLQFMGRADFLISTPVPLRPLVPFDSPDVFSTDFPEFDYYPEIHGWQEKERLLVSTVGYWPEGGQFPLLMADDMAKVFTSTLDPSITTEQMNSPEMRSRLLAAHGILTNFACAVATAYNQGFTLYHELTYPIVSQCIISDGRLWHFSKLQLNTMAFGADFNQDKQNIAWSSDELKLYDTIENGKVQGLNKDVVARILAALQAAREPVDCPAPYVDLTVETEFLERGSSCWRHMASRRFKLAEYLEAEIPMWVKIYKMSQENDAAPLLKWERQKYLHMFQYNKRIYEAEKKVLTDKRKQRDRERLLKGLHLKKY